MKKNYLSKLLVAVFVVVLTAVPALAGGLPKPASKNPEAQKLIDKAWALDRADSTAETHKQCISLMEQADKLDPNNPSILTEISRYYWNHGDVLPKDTPEQKKKLEQIYAKGIAAAEKSLKVKETVAGHYWLAVNKAASNEFNSIFAQAAAFPSIYSHSQYVRKNDPGYYYGADGRLWSEIIARVPKRVVEIVGTKFVKEASDDIDSAIKIEPRYLDNYTYKARFLYVYFGKKEEALKLCDYVLKQNPNIFPEEVTANKSAQKGARILWKRITGKEYPQK